MGFLPPLGSLWVDIFGTLELLEDILYFALKLQARRGRRARQKGDLSMTLQGVSLELYDLISLVYVFDAWGLILDVLFGVFDVIVEGPSKGKEKEKLGEDKWATIWLILVLRYGNIHYMEWSHKSDLWSYFEALELGWVACGRRTRRCLMKKCVYAVFGKPTAECPGHSGVARDCPEYGQHRQHVFWLGFLDEHHMQVTLGPIKVRISGN